jgi:glycerol-3-phosphate dehydrogenase (NAD(P)+)
MGNRARHTGRHGGTPSLCLGASPRTVPTVDARTTESSVSPQRSPSIYPDLHDRASEAVTQAGMVVFAVPSHALRGVAHSLAPLLTGAPLLVSATKGIEEETLQTMTTVLAEELPLALRSQVSVLSGLLCRGGCPRIAYGRYGCCSR